MKLKGPVFTIMLSSEKTLPPDRPAPKPVAWLLFIILAGLIFLTFLFTVFDWDPSIARQFYSERSGWFLKNKPLWVWLHDYGTIPGILFTLAALIGWAASFYVKRWSPWRKPCLVVVLTTLLAAGFLVNAVLKQYWGRPRPDQTIMFGGKWDYRPIFPPGAPGKGASFPCGHCTMGFVFLGAAAFRRQSKILAYGGIVTGILLGGLLSVARVVQGAHFVNDTIWSFGIVGMVALALDAYLPVADVGVRAGPPKTVSLRRKILVTLLATTAILAISLGFMTRRPYYNTMLYPLEFSTTLEAIHIQINTDPESFGIAFEPRNDAQLKVDAHGFGWMEHDYRLGFGTQHNEKALNLTLHIEANSYFSELNHTLTLILPESVKETVKVFLNQQRIDKVSVEKHSDTGEPTVNSTSAGYDRIHT